MNLTTDNTDITNKNTKTVLKGFPPFVIRAICAIRGKMIVIKNVLTTDNTDITNKNTKTGLKGFPPFVIRAICAIRGKIIVIKNVLTTDNTDIQTKMYSNGFKPWFIPAVVSFFAIHKVSFDCSFLPALVKSS